VRDFNKDVDVLKVRFEIGDQVYGRAFWNHPDFDVPVPISHRPDHVQTFWHKFLAQMKRAVVLRSPD
jgi:hypothetical protein